MPRREPAVGRAAQVQEAIRLENATGQPPAAAAPPGGPPRLAEAPAGAQQGAPPTAADLLAGSPRATLAGAAETAHPAASGILRGLSAMVNQRGGVMTMRLAPPDLGQLRVEMSIARGVVSARFQAGTAEASAVLEGSLPALRAALESHGLVVDRLSVHAAHTTAAAPPRHDGAGEQAATDPRHQADAGDGRSRGRHEGGDAGGGGRPQRDPREGARFGFEPAGGPERPRPARPLMRSARA